MGNARKFLAYIRMAGTVIVLAYYLSGLIIRSRIFGFDQRRAFLYRSQFIHVAMRILHIRCRFEGERHTGPCLYISNHRSLSDPLIQLGEIRAYIVSKAEVAKYPLIGRGARETGVVFVKRSDKKSRSRARDTIAKLFENGQSVLVYAEGTTSDEPTTLPFRIGAFKVAVECHVPVVPVVIEYADPSDYWSGQTTLLQQFIRTFSKSVTAVRVRIGPSIEGDDARTLMQSTRRWINAHIPEMRKQFSNHSSQPNH